MLSENFPDGRIKIVCHAHEAKVVGMDSVDRAAIPECVKSEQGFSINKNNSVIAVGNGIAPGAADDLAALGIDRGIVEVRSGKNHDRQFLPSRTDGSEKFLMRGGQMVEWLNLYRDPAAGALRRGQILAVRAVVENHARKLTKEMTDRF